MVNRLNKTLQEILQPSFDKKTDKYVFSTNSFKKLNGFDFNINSPIRKSLNVDIESNIADGILTVEIPGITIDEHLILPSKELNYCRIRLYLYILNLQGGLYLKGHIISTLEISKRNAVLEPQTLTFPVPDGCLCLMVIGLQYGTLYAPENLNYNDKTFTPTAFCSTLISPGVADITERPEWNSLNVKF